MDKVYIRRAPNLNGLPEEYVAKGKVKVGGCASGEAALTGLTDAEIQAVMPKILGINANAQDFMSRVQNYFTDIEFLIPAGNGLELNVTMTEKVVTVDGEEVKLPVNARDFVRYKYCQAYPDCAKNEEIVQGGGYRMFIFDEAVKVEKDYALLKERRAAQALYLEVSSDIDTVDMILTLLGENPAEMKEGAKMIALELAANNFPVRFAKIAKDKNLALKAKVQKMVSKNIIERVGNSYIFGNEPLGNHTDNDPYKEVVIFLKNPVNSEVMIRAFAKLGEEPVGITTAKEA